METLYSKDKRLDQTLEMLVSTELHQLAVFLSCSRLLEQHPQQAGVPHSIHKPAGLDF